MRPDPVRIRNNAAVIFDGAGATASLRSYVSASAGNPRFGVGPGFYYQTLPFVGLFGYLQPQERDQPGGQTQASQFGVTTEFPVKTTDEVIWNSTAYRLDGNPVETRLGGRVLWRSPLKMAGATG